MKKLIKRREIPGGNPVSDNTLLDRLYRSRHIKNSQELDRTLQSMLNPNQLYGIQQAVNLLVYAYQQKQKIVIVGDFDADGATSTALSVLALCMLGFTDVEYLVPNRFEHPVEGVEHEDNLIVRAARLLMKTAADSGRLPTGSGADISIDKRLPMGGGLGGGSSNAATVLVALNHLWQCGLSMDELAEMGLTLGADVPVFVRGHAAFAEGVGEILTPVDPPEKWYLVAHPGVSIPTPVIFKDPELPRNTPKRSIETLLKCEFSNDCEVIARKRFREVDAVLSWLLEYAPSRLTGTGACVFAEFDTESEARQVLEQAPEWLNGFVAKGVNLSPLHRAML